MMCDRTRSVNVVRVKDNRSNTSAQSAAEFRQAALGGARVKRVPGEFTGVVMCGVQTSVNLQHLLLGLFTNCS
jgi:hypothetical protein